MRMRSTPPTSYFLASTSHDRVGMGSTKNSKQPWVGWVEERERLLELLTSIAKLKIEEGLHGPRDFVSGKWKNRYVHTDAIRSALCLRSIEPRRMNASSCSQHEQVTWVMEQQSAELRRALLFKRGLNQCPHVAYGVDNNQLLPRLKSDETIIQEMTPKNVSKSASKAPQFETSQNIFDGSCHSPPASTTTRHTLVESSHSIGQGWSDEKLEVGNSQFKHEEGNFYLRTQSTSLRETLGVGSLKTSGAEHHGEDALALSGNLRILEPVVCYREELPMNQTMKETDRPMITWLKGGLKKAPVVGKSKNDVMILFQSFDRCQLCKGFDSSSRYCVACNEHVNPQQFRISEPMQRRIRKHVDQHLPERNNLPFRKREKTRSGLSCHILGGANDAKSQGRTSSKRREKGYAWGADLRTDVQRKSTKEKRKNLLIAQKPLVVSLERFLMDLLNDEDVGKNWLSAPGTLIVGSDKDFTRHSVENLVEDGPLESSQPLNRKGEPSSPPNSLSSCLWPNMDAFITVPTFPNELLRGEPNEALDDFQPELNEGDEKKIKRIAEMQRLADKILDALLMDVAVELSRMCTAVVENIIAREFGDIGR